MELDQNSALIEELHDPLTHYTLTHVLAWRSTKHLGFLKDIWSRSITGYLMSRSKTSHKAKQIKLHFKGHLSWKIALLLRNTYNAIRMWDRDRILRNFKFEMLCASVRGHTKYKLWLWRFQTYVSAILTPKEAKEYFWNCTACTNGCTKKISPMIIWWHCMNSYWKKNHQETGRELHIFECQESSSLSLSLSAHLQMEMKEKFEEHAASLKAWKTRTKTDSSNDVYLKINILLAARVFHSEAGRTYGSFDNFKNVFERNQLTFPNYIHGLQCKKIFEK